MGCLAATLAPALLSAPLACTAIVGLNNDRQPDGGIIDEGDGLGDAGGKRPGEAATEDDCPELPAVASEDALVQRFSDEIHPLMTRQGQGCLSCHAAGSGRLLEMGATPTETYFKLKTADMLRFGPGRMYDRVARDSMPAGGPYWSDDDKESLFSFVCAFSTWRAAGPDEPPVDEVFPPALEQPYTGPPATEYDNTFLTFDQLKGRVRVQFGDDWVRDGVDLFHENISLFGGVDFTTSYIPARGATPEFLVGLSVMAPDVCQRAVALGSGPFVDVDTAAPVREEPASETRSFAATDLLSIDAAGAVRASPWAIYGSSPAFLSVSTNGGGRVELSFPIAGRYTFEILAQGDEAGPELPHMELRVGDLAPFGFDVPESQEYIVYTAQLDVSAGVLPVDVVFTNDYYMPEDVDPTQRDRNLRLAGVTIKGPLPGSTEGAPGAQAATMDRLSLVFERILLRDPVRADAEPTLDEILPLYQLLLALEGEGGDRASAWSGVCEALLLHPDFLFTRPPHFDVAGDDDRERLLLIKTALDLLFRPPTSAELLRYDVGEVTRADLVTEWLASEELARAFFHRARVLLETDGSEQGDEPARLLTHLFLEDKPVKELLIGSYAVDTSFAAEARAPEHGATGLLTMPGYIRGKPGLPHYNYAARVLTGFLGEVFEVPPEVFDERATATAASTVDPASVCYGCHRLLTPLAHQRLRWADDGSYRATFEDGTPIDDSDRGLVDDYPFAGSGLAAFAEHAVRKEGFLRRMANTQFELLMGRPMRAELDERALYRELWEILDGGDGTLREVLLHILFDEAYVDPVGSHLVPAGDLP